MSVVFSVRVWEDSFKNEWTLALQPTCLVHVRAPAPAETQALLPIVSKHSLSLAFCKLPV